MRAEHTFVSVIVPFYNEEQYIQACCEALLAQQYPQNCYEIIMIDNNSSDSSADIVRQQPRIRLLQQSKQGAYAARNAGLEVAKGDIIAFTDPDCVPDLNWLRQIVDAIQDSTLQVAAGSYSPATKSFTLTMLAEYENAKNHYIFNSLDPMLYYGYTNNLAVRSALFREIGLFLERKRGADAIFVKQVVDHYGCDSVGYIPGMKVRHLEIDSFFRFCEKAYVHARSIQQFSNQMRVRSLNFKERLISFRRMAAIQEYNMIRSALALGMLGVGLVYWMLGKISGYLGK